MVAAESSFQKSVILTFFLGDFAPTRIIRVSIIARCPQDEFTVKGLECISNESQTEQGLRSVVQ